MDSNLATNSVKCLVCPMTYLACTSCRLYGTELCQFGLSDPRAPMAGHDNPGFESDLGRTASGTIDLNQPDPFFKAEAHMPSSSGTTEVPANQTDRANK